MLYGAYSENGTKCWRRYFESRHFTGLQEGNLMPSRSAYAYFYLADAVKVVEAGHPIVFPDCLIPLREEILSVCDQARRAFEERLLEDKELRLRLKMRIDPETLYHAPISIGDRLEYVRRAELVKVREGIESALKP